MRILYLDLDALSPRHLSCYGYPRATSPAIDAVARDGVRFDRVYCSDAPCLPSRTAFYQGRFGIQTGVVGHGGTAGDPKRQGASRGFRSTYEEDGFARQLQKLGFHTAMVSPFGQRHAAHQFYAGFNEIHNTGLGGMEDVKHVQPVLDRWLDENASDDSWYLHVNFWDIHTPYRAPESFGNPFENEPLPEWWPDETLASHVKRAGPHSAQDLGMFVDADTRRFPRQPLRITDRASLKQWIDGYDTAIRYVDEYVGRVVAGLKDAGVYDDTAIIISADHGENQGQLGIYGEHGTADDGTCRVPMIVKWPGGPAAGVDTGLHYHLDWAPTCLELLGHADAVPEVWDGESYARVIGGADGVVGRGATGREELILSQCAHVCQRSVRWDRWLYIRTYHDGFHPFPKHMLFDLENDPRENHNLAEERPEIVIEASARLLEWHDGQMRKMHRYASDVVDPLWTVMSEGGPFHAGVAEVGSTVPNIERLRLYLERLEQTGRADGATDLRRRYRAAIT